MTKNIEFPDDSTWKIKGASKEHMELVVRMHTSLSDATEEELRAELSRRKANDPAQCQAPLPPTKEK